MLEDNTKVGDYPLLNNSDCPAWYTWGNNAYPSHVADVIFIMRHSIRVFLLLYYKYLFPFLFVLRGK